MRINCFFGLSAIVIVALVLLWYTRKNHNCSSTQPDRENRSSQDGINRDSQQRSTLQAKPKLTATLQKLLISGRWEEADHETLRIMLKVSSREEEGWLDVESIQDFSTDTLRAIDQLWVNSSDGHFGFSIQQSAWKSVGGNLNADDRIYKAFSDRVGWHVDKEWLQVKDLNFDISSSTGHLPALAVRQGGLSWGVDGFWWKKREAYVFLLSQKDW